jgi:transmembrane protein EpsG
MSILSTGFYAISIFTSGMYLGRIPIYFSLFNYILLPWEIKLIFEEDMQKTINLAAIVFYLAYYVYQTHFTWGLF